MYEWSTHEMNETNEVLDSTLKKLHDLIMFGRYLVIENIAVPDKGL